MVLPFMAICQCPVPAASNTISQPVPDLPTCGNTDPSVINGTASGTYSYQWQLSADNVNFADIGGATSASYDPTAIIATTYYRRKVTTSTCTAPSYSNVITVTIYQLAPIIIMAPAQTNFTCGGDADLIVGSSPTGGDGNYTYEWLSSTGNGYTFIPGATSKDYDPPYTTVTTSYERFTLMTTCGTGVAISNVVDIIINHIPPLTGNVISQTTPDGVLCAANANPSLILGSVPAGGTGNYSYQWQQSTDNVNFTNITLSGAQLNYDPPIITTATYYRRVVTATNSTCTPPIFSNVITIDVIAGPPVLNNTITQPTPDPQFCTTNATPSIITGMIATGAGTLSYQWQRSNDNNFFTDIPGATGQDYTPTAINTTTYYRRTVVSNVCIVPSTSNVITVLVTPPIVNAITAPAAVLNFCGPARPTTMSGSVPPGQGYSFQWQISTDMLNFTDIPGATTVNYSPPTISITTSYRRVLTVSVCAISSISNAITTTIHQFSTITNNSVSQAVPDPVFCANTADPSVISGTVPISTESFTYQWQSSADNSTFVNITGATDIDYDPGVITATTYYRRMAMGGVFCITPSSSNVITITLTPVITSNVITAPPVVTFCGNGDAELITGNSVSSNGLAYQWQSSTDGTTFTDISGAISNNYDPPAVGSTLTYRRIITSGSCSTPSVSNLVTITVTAGPIATVSGPVSICAGSSTTLTASGGAAYQWSPATGLSATNVASPVATPLTTTTYTVTVGNGSCTIPRSITVTVVPKPKVDAGSDKGILNGDKVQLAGQVTGSADVRYSWSPTTYLSDPAVLKPIATPTQDITYTLTATTPDGCFVVSDDVTVKVYEKIVIPNAFTPNADGVNDTWDIIALNGYENSQLDLYNRNGTLIFKSTGYTKPWDGTYKGKQVPTGTYYYTIDLKNGSKPLSGWVSIIK
jgi:gliding motility-associated-like protein